MNIGQAKAIPLALIFDKISLCPTKPKHNKQLWYLSPWQMEKTASLHVHTGKNMWYDHGEGIGGSVIDLDCQYLKACHESNTIRDALRWLPNMAGNSPMIAAIKVATKSTNDESKPTLKDKQPIKHLALIQYLKKRGIPFPIGSRYFFELRLLKGETKKTFLPWGGPM